MKVSFTENVIKLHGKSLHNYTTLISFTTILNSFDRNRALATTTRNDAAADAGTQTHASAAERDAGHSDEHRIVLDKELYVTDRRSEQPNRVRNAMIDADHDAAVGRVARLARKCTVAQQRFAAVRRREMAKLDPLAIGGNAAEQSVGGGVAHADAIAPRRRRCHRCRRRRALTLFGADF